MSNLELGTKATVLDVIISRCSPDSKHRRSDRHHTNSGCSFFRYTNDDHWNHANQRRKHKTWTKEDNQLALHCYLRSKATRREYRNRMIEMRQECDSFQTTRQKHADQVRIMIKRDWFSDLKILEIHQKKRKEKENEQTLIQ